MTVDSWISQGNNLRQVILTIALISTVTSLKFIYNFRIRKSRKFSSIEKIRKIKTTSNYLTFISIFLLFILWFSHLQTVMISFVAVVAAIVVATKEVIMTFMGGVLIKMNNHYEVGDRIEVDGIRGFVVERNLTTTKVLEIGPEKHSQQTTGDIITIPNSLVLTKAVVNESYFKNYSIKSFAFSLPPGVTFDEFEVELLSWSNEICKDYLKEAKKIIEKFCHKEGLLIPNVEPRVRLVMTEKKELEVLLKLPAKNEYVGDVEQNLFRKYALCLTTLEKAKS